MVSKKYKLTKLEKEAMELIKIWLVGAVIMAFIYHIEVTENALNMIVHGVIFPFLAGTIAFFVKMLFEGD